MLRGIGWTSRARNLGTTFSFIFSLGDTRNDTHVTIRYHKHLETKQQDNDKYLVNIYTQRIKNIYIQIKARKSCLLRIRIKYDTDLSPINHCRCYRKI